MLVFCFFLNARYKPVEDRVKEGKERKVSGLRGEDDEKAEFSKSCIDVLTIARSWIAHGVTRTMSELDQILCMKLSQSTRRWAYLFFSLVNAPAPRICYNGGMEFSTG
jgi:hypothetical protein